jgi:hypothetical protein
MQPFPDAGRVRNDRKKTMNCDQLQNTLDEFMDGTMNTADLESLRAHATTCESCAALLARERELRRRLRDYAVASVPAPAPGFYKLALSRAVREGREQHRRRSWLTGFGSAVAAGVAIWFVGSMLISSTAPVAPEASLPTVAMTVEEPRTINLVFSSTTRMDNATLTVLLPDGMRIAGLDGQHITWTTSLSKGRNVLPLQLVAAYPASGELLATLQHDGADRTFRLRIDVT